MIVKTNYSSYEIDICKNSFRKIIPDMGSWHKYLGFIFEPVVGSSMLIVRDDNVVVKTSRVSEVLYSDAE